MSACQEYDGGDCCECTCSSEGDHDFACGEWGGFNCLDPDAPCFGFPRTLHHQQMRIKENGYLFKVTRFEGGLNAPYRIYFWNDDLTGSTYRFDGNGDLVYFKAGSEIYHNIVHDDVHGTIEFSRKAESGGGGKTYDDDHKAGDPPMQDSREEFNCYQCWEALSAVCGAVFGHVGGLERLCGAVDRYTLGSDGADSVGILCDNWSGTCANAMSQCVSACGIGEW